MKKAVITAMATVALVAAPVSAGLISGGTLEAAKLILKGRKLLKAGETKCGSSLQLAPEENLLLSLAKSRVKKALPASQFLALDKAADSETTKATSVTNFCDTAKTDKPKLLDQVKEAATKFGLGKLGL